MHMEVRALFGRFVWRGISIYEGHNPSFLRFEDQSQTEGVRTQPGRTRFRILQTLKLENRLFAKQSSNA